MAKKTSPGKVRVAMVGAGGQGNTAHWPSLASFEDVEIVAVCELKEKLAREAAEKYNVPKVYVGDDLHYKKMLEEVAPDAVYAIGQPNIMFEVWLNCLVKGFNLYIEKPMGISAHMARMLAYTAEKHDCITQVSFQRRIAPIAVKMKEEVIKRGGPINHAVCTFYKWCDDANLAAPDHMYDDCVHAIDTLRWLCGGELVDIESTCKRLEVPNINYITGLMQFDTGATGVLMNSWRTGRRIFGCEMHSTGCYATVEHENDGVLYDHGDYEGKRMTTQEAACSDNYLDWCGFRPKNREFIDAIKGGPMPASNFSDAVKTMEIAETILSQAQLMGV
jgi:virulence factor